MSDEPVEQYQERVKIEAAARRVRARFEADVEAQMRKEDTDEAARKETAAREELNKKQQELREAQATVAKLQGVAKVDLDQ